MKKKFYIFLIINLVLWILVESLRTVISVDSMEAINWGELISWGTNKHPMLSGWLAGGFYNLLGQTNFAIYLLGQLCVACGLFYVYKTAKLFLNENKAICASLFLTITYYYTFQVFYDNFNCNVILMGLLPITIYYFYKSTNENKLFHWIIFGFLAGLSFLAKYQAIFLFMGMFVYLIISKRELFKKKGVYISIFVGMLTIFPHLIWLFNNDFLPFVYLIGKSNSSNESSVLINFFNRFFFPIKFYVEQFLSLIGCFVLYLLVALREKNISFKKFDIKNNNDNFILSVCLLPLILIGLIGVVTASKVTGAWGMAFVYGIGICLFYFFPIEFKQDTFNYLFKWYIGIMIGWQIAMVGFVMAQTKIDFSYPHTQIMKDFDIIWAKNTNGAPLKYVKGDGNFVFQFRLYDKQKPTVILDTFGQKNPWIDTNKALKDGILVLGYDKQDARNTAIELLENNNTQIKPHKYTFEIQNKFNNSEKHEFYYVIIPPQN